MWGRPKKERPMLCRGKKGGAHGQGRNIFLKRKGNLGNLRPDAPRGGGGNQVGLGKEGSPKKFRSGKTKKKRRKVPERGKKGNVATEGGDSKGGKKRTNNLVKHCEKKRLPPRIKGKRAERPIQKKERRKFLSHNKVSAKTRGKGAALWKGGVTSTPEKRKKVLGEKGGLPTFNSKKKSAAIKKRDK